VTYQIKKNPVKDPTLNVLIQLLAKIESQLLKGSILVVGIPKAMMNFIKAFYIERLEKDIDIYQITNTRKKKVIVICVVKRNSFIESSLYGQRHVPDPTDVFMMKFTAIKAFIAKTAGFNALVIHNEMYNEFIKMIEALEIEPDKLQEYREYISENNKKIIERMKDDGI
jgi:hypothetical protein